MSQVLERVDALAELNERVAHVLARNTYLARRQVRAEADNGRVRLEGTVGTFYQKQMAQELVRRVEGVSEIDNRLEVHWV